MVNRNFMQLLETQWSRENEKFVSVGLDSDFDRVSGVFNHSYLGRKEEMVCAFNQEIVDATADLVCAYKINTAFYEAYGARGFEALENTVMYIRTRYPEVPIILDAKRADIGNTNKGYVRMAFDHLGADAITVHPYFGREAMEPFLKRKDKGIIVLCRTSNPGAGEFQDIIEKTSFKPTHQTLYQSVAQRVSEHWNANGNCLLVVGATYSEELRSVRKIVGDMPLLIPGIGAQGGDLRKVITAGKDSRGQGMIINSSRGIIFASEDKDSFGEAARRKTEELHNLINQYRKGS